MIRFSLSSFGLALLLAGCGSSNPVKPGSDGYGPTYPVVQAQPQPADGAIYHPSTVVNLYGDTRAHRVGDVITVLLEEKTRAQKQQDTDIKKNARLNLPNPTLFGSNVEFNMPGLVPMASNVGNTLALDANSQNDFSAEADSAQSNLLEGQITVTVSQVLPNGNLVIRGEKWLTLNQGDEYIRISGIVRPQDVSADNLVASNRIANAQISYSGKGTLSDANSPGWLSRFFNSGWWPF